MDEKKWFHKIIIKIREKYSLRFLIIPLIMFLIIPLIIVIFPFVIEIFNLSTFRYYRAYYATVLTLFFAIFSFIYQQNKILKDQKKQNEIEQEEENNYYRPLFLVENMEGTPKLKQVILLMKNDSLYLEDVQVYDNENELLTPQKESFQSKNIVKQNISYPFYITGRTMTGEIILFAYLYGGKKCYKYLKYDKDPSFPNKLNNIKLDEVNEVWGTYNSRTKENDTVLDILLFQNTKILRSKIKKSNFIMFEKSFLSKTVEDFMKNIFNDLKNYIDHNNSDEYYNNIYNLLLKILKRTKKEMNLEHNIKNSSNPYVKLEQLSLRYTPSYKKLEKDYIAANDFIVIILEIMETQKDKNKENFCFDVIEILTYTFKEVKIEKPLTEYRILLDMKDDIYTLEN